MFNFVAVFSAAVGACYFREVKFVLCAVPGFTIDVIPNIRGSLMLANDSSQNKYSLVKGAARRARQLQSGAPALGVSNSMKACKVAQDELLSGKVTYTLGTKKPVPPIES
jgi:DNA-directed RNA polymerase subunit omega